jgi:hypothetical protein
MFRFLSASPIDLLCRMSFNPGERWTRCSWTHQIVDVWVGTEDCTS